MPRNPALSETLSCFFDAEGNIPAGDRDAFRGLERAGIHAGGELKGFPTDSATENQTAGVRKNAGKGEKVV